MEASPQCYSNTEQVIIEETANCPKVQLLGYRSLFVVDQFVSEPKYTRHGDPKKIKIRNNNIDNKIRRDSKWKRHERKNNKK